MSDIERVRQMVKDGRITEAEGEQLIGVLSSANAADNELQAAGEQIDAEARAIEAGNPRHLTGAPLPPLESEGQVQEPTTQQGGASGPPAPRTASTPATPEAPATPRAPAPPATPSTPPTPATPTSAAPTGTRWVSLQMLAGDLDVVVDDTIDQPEVESDGPVDVIVERSDQGFRVRWDQPSGSFLDKMLGKLRSGNLSMRLPAGYGLDLAATAGDVDLVDVPYLRGHLTAGDLDATGLKGIDFTSRAGDIEVEAELTSGSHRLSVTAGNVVVRLAPSSSVAIKADASIGDITSRLPELKTSSRSLGESLAGNYGAGAATLDVAVTTGSVKLDVRRG